MRYKIYLCHSNRLLKFDTIENRGFYIEISNSLNFYNAPIGRKI